MENQNKSRYIHEIYSFLLRLAAFVAIIWIIFGVVFGITTMKNADMQPQIHAGDLMLYYRLGSSYIADDVVVVKHGGKEITGRIVAVPGDSIEITEEHKLVINGSVVIENDIFYETLRYESDVKYPVKLGKDEYFILGDLRSNAEDSRNFGAVNIAHIKGKVISILRKNNI